MSSLLLGVCLVCIGTAAPGDTGHGGDTLRVLSGECVGFDHYSLLGTWVAL